MKAIQMTSDRKIIRFSQIHTRIIICALKIRLPPDQCSSKLSVVKNKKCLRNCPASRIALIPSNNGRYETRFSDIIVYFNTIHNSENMKQYEYLVIVK